MYECVSVEPGCLVRSSPSSLPALPGGCEKPMGVGRRGQVCSLSRAAPWRLCLYISTPRGGGGGDTSLPPRGQGTFDNVWRHVCHIWEKECYWHPGVDRGQGVVNTLQCPGQPTATLYPRLRWRNPAPPAAEFLTPPAEPLLLGCAWECDRCYEKREQFCY